MGRTCTICQHEDRALIEEAMRKGASNRAISCQFQVGRMAAQRHRLGCMPAGMLEGFRAQRRLQDVMNVPNEMRYEWELLESLLDQTLAPFGTLPAVEAMMVIDTGFLSRLLTLRHRYFATMLQVLAAMPEATTVNVMVGSQWSALLRKLYDQVGDDPEMRKRISSILAPDIRGEYRGLGDGESAGSENGHVPGET
jgi:hypothetical protein